MADEDTIPVGADSGAAAPAPPPPLPTPPPDMGTAAPAGTPDSAPMMGIQPQLPPRPPGTGGLAQNPPDRKTFFRDMLGNFLYSAGTGLANAGHGPGANERGAGAAITAIPQLHMQQQQMDIAREQANSAQRYKEAQAASLTPTIAMKDAQGNDVMVPPAHVGQALAAGYNLAGKLGAASINTQGRQNVADTAAQSRTDVANIGAASRQKVAETNAANKPPTEMSLLMKSQQGDPDAKAALDKLQQNRLEVAKARGPASRPMNFYDPDLGRTVVMSASEAEAQQKGGKNLVQAGAAPADKIMQMQRASTAIPAALDEVEKNISAWDNPKDQAIFAKILKENPAGNGDPATWFSNVLDRAAQGQLSDKGQAGVIALRRLNDSLGSLRVISGLPSTVGSMITTAALAPSAHTPNAKVAKQQLDSIRQLVQQETGIKFLGGKGSEPGAKGTGALSREEANNYLQQAGGDPNKARVMARKDGRTF